jgi:type IX secretion system PorP/SprF family membrane protein
MKIFYTLLALLVAFTANAQQTPVYSQYIFNSMSINPAYTGSKNVLNLNLFHRSQWTGVDGAPSTQSISIDGITTNNKLGIGLGLNRDKIGAQSTISAFANVAAKIQVSESGVLSFGIAPGLVQQRVDGSEFGITNDPSIPQTPVSSVRPDVKLGAYYHTERFYAGLSASDLLEFEDDQTIEPKRNFFFTTGYVFDVTNFIKLKPSILVREDFNLPTNVDLNAFVLLGNRLWLGTSYRTTLNLSDEKAGDAKKPTSIVFIGELNISESLRVGYSYDKMLNSFGGMQTHEVSLGYYFLKNTETKVMSPQYF